jgi:hypothetical protein
MKVKDEPSSFAVRTSAGVAQLTSRRTFMRRTLEGAFALAASSALVNTVFAEQAEAALCGPSPYCYCCGDTIRTCGSATNCTTRNYGTSRCGTLNNCWSVRTSTGVVYLCCDCCCRASRGCASSSWSYCFGGTCTTNYKRCICQYRCC